MPRRRLLGNGREGGRSALFEAPTPQQSATIKDSTGQRCPVEGRSALTDPAPGSPRMWRGAAVFGRLRLSADAGSVGAASVSGKRLWTPIRSVQTPYASAADPWSVAPRAPVRPTDRARPLLSTAPPTAPPPRPNRAPAPQPRCRQRIPARQPRRRTELATTQRSQERPAQCAKAGAILPALAR